MKVIVIALLFVLVIGCIREENTRPAASKGSLLGDWESVYNTQVYDLPTYTLTLLEGGTFEAKAVGGWGQDYRIGGGYEMADGALSLTGTKTDKRTGKESPFEMKLRVNGDELIELSKDELHLIFRRKSPE